MLNGKTICVGVTGSIAAYKTASLVSMLIKAHAQVHVIMTRNACSFIHPITFETLTGNKCLVDTFDRNFEFHVAHVSLAKKADLFMIAPASANVIGKIACGIADDMLTTTVMAYKGPLYIAPAMNTAMYENSILQDNLTRLRGYGMHVITPASGFLACGDTGTGKMPEPEVLYSYILKELARRKDLAGKRIVVTAGPTREAIDPVRFISNHSTGKMGYAIAKAAMLRGADVTLISGPCTIDPPPFVRMISVISAKDMYDAVLGETDGSDILIMSAAVADYRPSTVADEKIKKKDAGLSIALSRTDDVIGTVGKSKGSLFLCGFSMETQNMVENSRAKLEKKNLDLIVANNVKQKGAGFATDTNIITMITKEEIKELPLMSKEDAADQILDQILSMI